MFLATLFTYIVPAVIMNIEIPIYVEYRKTVSYLFWPYIFYTTSNTRELNENSSAGTNKKTVQKDQI